MKEWYDIVEPETGTSIRYRYEHILTNHIELQYKRNKHHRTVTTLPLPRRIAKDNEDTASIGTFPSTILTNPC